MEEEVRTRELEQYHILDTEPEKELDEIAQIASAVCDTPMSLVTFIDSHRQWYKAKKGVDMNEVRRTDSFCQFTLDRPHELLVVDDPTTDERFKNNRYVVGAPFIRFYASAPLTSPSGNVLGTLCVMDSKRHHITEDQKEALQLLAKKAMQYLNMRKALIEQEHLIEHNAEKLKKLTDLAPGAMFQLERKSSKVVRLVFVSQGIEKVHSSLSVSKLQANPAKFIDIIHDDDRERINESFKHSFLNNSAWNEQFRVTTNDRGIQWFWIKATIERNAEGSIMYGSLHNISAWKQYEEVLHDILHDVSHVMRRPVVTMLGLASLMEEGVLEQDQVQKYMQHVKTVFGELDSFTRNLNQVYTEKMKRYRGATPPGE